mmetsp:Transcript_1812/g.2614  ORF Transcript_1812/g.2614 Transcript_1812/m.2614 type:complete len:659 (-) Transcript_1812:166-2142(-)
MMGSNGDKGIPLPPVPDRVRTSKEACINYYTGVIESLKGQIKLFGIEPENCLFERWRESILPSLQRELETLIAVEEAKVKVNQNNKNKVDEETKKKGEEDLTKARLDRDKAEEDALKVAAREIFPQLDEHAANLDDKVPQWKNILLQCMVLILATPQNLAVYAVGCDMKFDSLQQSLQNPQLMNQFLQAGDPCKFKYAEAFHIYNSIICVSEHARSGVDSNDIFHRLALAVALEHAEPKFVFDTQTPIDPIARYFHYEDAYLKEELDPCFQSLSVFDLRFVVDCDAADNEIQWCRNMLKNYRPDHVENPDFHWRYCMIVRTEVRYKAPDWKQRPKTYKQLISGGGMCGPRAWFGRLACKSFGVPTWGVRQPGHAAMSHWTSSSHSYTICLGGQNWEKSYWAGTNGRYFDFESRARSSLALKEFPGLFVLTRCIAAINGEVEVSSQSSQWRTPARLKNIWTELRRLKIREMSNNASDHHLNEQKAQADEDYVFVEKIGEDMIQTQKSVSFLQNGDFVLQASSCCEADEGGGRVKIMKSFLEDGGQQVHLRQEGFVKYIVDLTDEAEGEVKIVKFKLTCRIVTVHADTTPLILGISPSKSLSSGFDEYEIQIPYSEGEWTTTEPVVVHLVPGEKNLLHFFREDPSSLGLTIKDFSFQRLD